MDFFDDLGKKIMKAGNEVSAKAKEVSEVVSLKASLRKEEEKLNEIFKTIGKKYYEEHKNEEGCFCSEDFAAVEACKAGIETLKKQIQEAKGTVLCPNCNCDVNADASFCPKCGTKI